MSGHTSQEFGSELRTLRERLLKMGGRCETMIALATEALEKRDAERADRVLTLDDEMNADELFVDELAIRVLALRQPMGRDLRFTITAVKVVTDLERIGDEAVNLAERAQELSRAQVNPLTIQLCELSRRASAMLHDALDAFVDEDADKARRVIEMDDEVDERYGALLRACEAHIRESRSEVRAGLCVASGAKYAERIADHATNIAEMVVYFTSGEQVKHANLGSGSESLGSGSESL